MTHLKIGDNAPKFQGILQDGSELNSDQLKGSKYILFFYPKDDSPGCTRQACNLRDNYKWFDKNGFKIYGVSPDSAKKHQKFIDKYEFQYDLIADQEKEIINAFGIWGPKKFMGREFDGVHRTTFVMNEEGKIIDIIAKVKTKEHAEQLKQSLAGATA